MDRRDFIKAAGVAVLGFCETAAPTPAPGGASGHRAARPPALSFAGREGARVRLVGGVFDSFEGLLTAVDEGQGVGRVEFTLHGRPVPVEAPLSQIELVGRTEA